MASEHERRDQSPPEWDRSPTTDRSLVVATLSPRLARTPHLDAALGGQIVISPVGRRVDAVIAPANSLLLAPSRRLAAALSVPLCTVDRGFLAGIWPEDAPLSFLVDDLGHHADARGPSRIEAALASDDDLTDLRDRAAALIETMRAGGLSRDNDAPTDDFDLAEAAAIGVDQAVVLLIDQATDDPAIEAGLATAEAFETMLETARREHPMAEIVVWRDPESFAVGSERGHLDAAAAVTHLDGRVVPLRLFERASAVYTVTARIGIEALMAGTPVTCFGVPFYAGWGATDDRGPACVRRVRDRDLLDIVAAAYLRCARYVDPNEGGVGRAESVAEHLALQRREFAKNRGRIFCVGFHSWKRRIMRRYLRAPGNEIHFAKTAARAEELGFDAGSRLLTWGQRGDEAAHALMSKHGVPRWRVEDAFLRSVGLGSDITMPASLVLDREGIYYDPRTPSELERILESGDVTDDDIERAARLRQRIVESRLSKYNVGHDATIETPEGARVVLVPGQVSDDASVQLGCRDIRTNDGLLAAAREAAPDAFIIFKPHPDVVSGNRDGAVPAEVAERYADRIIDDVSLADCLAASDEVHTMTSLVGFEALLRGLRVFVYGQPFYAGWGLTTDRHPVARRGRRLTIDELAAAALIRYPRYLHPVTGRFTTPEAILDHLAAARENRVGERTIKVSRARRYARKMAHIIREFAGDP